MNIAKFITAVGVMIFLVFAITNRLNSTVDQLFISVSKSVDNKSLLSKKEVNGILKSVLGYDVRLSKMGQLDLFSLESALQQDDRINKAKIYLDKFNNLYVNVEQKAPIVRIDVTGGEDFYLDYKGDRIPVTEVFRVPIVTGNVDKYSPNYKNIKTHNLHRVLNLAQKIHDDEFLLALIEQIHIDDNNEVTLVPKVGRDRILLGQIEDMDEKIYNLKAYYEHGVKNIGIDKFDELDIRWTDQVVFRDTDT